MDSNCRKKHTHGVSRSLVRRIGSSLPINTGQRMYVQLPSIQSPVSEYSQLKYAATGQVYQIFPSDGLVLAGNIEEPKHLIRRLSEEYEKDDDFHDEDVFRGTLCQEVDENLPSEPEKNALQKISALEAELAKLKAQIAVYALSESNDCQLPSPLPVPPPPPPPPPPPGCVSHESDTVTAPTKSQIVAVGSSTTTNLTTPAMQVSPMVDMLNDIGSIQLRSVNTVKSPGGTPLRQRSFEFDAASNDPASIIAQALRKKFSHGVFQDSPDKKSFDQLDSSLFTDFESPHC